jgi:hypothetical protein
VSRQPHLLLPFRKSLFPHPVPARFWFSFHFISLPQDRAADSRRLPILMPWCQVERDGDYFCLIYTYVIMDPEIGIRVWDWWDLSPVAPTARSQGNMICHDVENDPLNPSIHSIQSCEYLNEDRREVLRIEPGELHEAYRSSEVFDGNTMQAEPSTRGFQCI